MEKADFEKINKNSNNDPKAINKTKYFYYFDRKENKQIQKTYKDQM
jgi:hypothetical protein